MIRACQLCGASVPAAPGELGPDWRWRPGTAEELQHYCDDAPPNLAGQPREEYWVDTAIYGDTMAGQVPDLRDVSRLADMLRLKVGEDISTSLARYDQRAYLLVVNDQGPSVRPFFHPEAADGLDVVLMDFRDAVKMLRGKEKR